MLLENTPLEDHLDECGLLVKREDLSCPPPGPPFSKTRGVLAHVQARHAEGVRLFGVLDTYHSQAGHAVAAACRTVGAQCVNFFPVFKREVQTGPLPTDDPTVQWANGWAPLRAPQVHSRSLGAQLIPLQAGRSAVLFHQAKKATLEAGGYMMPNALKLPETVAQTAAEVVRTIEHASKSEYKQLHSTPWIVASSSGTIAAGVLKGLQQFWPDSAPQVIVHMGYDRPAGAVMKYICEQAGRPQQAVEAFGDVKIINEGYQYSDKAKPGPTPPWPCNEFYDLKALRWWLREGRAQYGQAVLWNIG